MISLNIVLRKTSPERPLVQLKIRTRSGRRGSAVGLLHLNHIITEFEALNHGYLLRDATTRIGVPFDAAFEAFLRVRAIKIPSR